MQARHPLIHPVRLTLPSLPSSLAGLRVAHLTDLHISRPRKRHRLIQRLVAELSPDLIILTGDYMSSAGDEDASRKVMAELTQSFDAKHGTWGVFGNHDTARLRAMLADLPVHWLHNEQKQVPGLPLYLAGMQTLRQIYPDSLELLTFRCSTMPRNTGESSVATDPSHDAQPPLRLMLCHHPTYLPVAADLGYHLMFSGHTHGGQCRLPFKRALINSTDMPMHLTSGVLRHKDTLAMVSRGLGEVHLPLRVFCPPQLPVYELTAGPLPGESSQHVHNTQPW